MADELIAAIEKAARKTGCSSSLRNMGRSRLPGNHDYDGETPLKEQLALQQELEAPGFESNRMRALYYEEHPEAPRHRPVMRYLNDDYTKPVDREVPRTAAGVALRPAPDKTPRALAAMAGPKGQNSDEPYGRFYEDYIGGQARTAGWAGTGMPSIPFIPEPSIHVPPALKNTLAEYLPHFAGRNAETDHLFACLGLQPGLPEAEPHEGPFSSGPLFLRARSVESDSSAFSEQLLPTDTPDPEESRVSTKREFDQTDLGTPESLEDVKLEDFEASSGEEQIIQFTPINKPARQVLQPKTTGNKSKAAGTQISIPKIKYAGPPIQLKIAPTSTAIMPVDEPAEEGFLRPTQADCQARYYEGYLPPSFENDASRPLFQEPNVMPVFRRPGKKPKIPAIQEICNCCGTSGHAQAACPDLTCSHCGAYDEHFSHACPSAYMSATPYDSHTIPESRRKPTAALIYIRPKCYNCAGSSHYGDDCPWRVDNFEPGLGGALGIAPLIRSPEPPHTPGSFHGATIMSEGFASLEWGAAYSRGTLDQYYQGSAKANAPRTDVISAWKRRNANVAGEYVQDYINRVGETPGHAIAGPAAPE